MLKTIMQGRDWSKGVFTIKQILLETIIIL